MNIIGENDTVLDAKGTSGIFFVSGDNVAISDIKLVNAINTHKIGAIRWQGDNGILSNCILENNNDNGFGYGGAIIWWATNGKINNCIFKNNKVSHYGGAIYINGKGLKVTNSLFEYNSVLESYNRWEGGGAIYSDEQNHIIEYCTFRGNNALKSWGGAIKKGCGSLSVRYNTFINNFAFRGNNIYTDNFDTIKENRFYIKKISEIKASAEGDDNIKLINNNNNFIVDGNIISKDEYLFILNK